MGIYDIFTRHDYCPERTIEVIGDKIGGPDPSGRGLFMGQAEIYLGLDQFLNYRSKASPNLNWTLSSCSKPGPSKNE